MTRTVLISGAGIAGNAAALLLARAGWAVTVVERAPAPRPGGQAVDLKGSVHRVVLERLGIRDAVLAAQTGGLDQTIVDARGDRIAVIPGEFTGGDVEVRRGDLAAILHERAADGCEYVFGDSVTSLTETPDGVHATFTRGAPRTVDLVVGADGIHSAVRGLAFGPEERFVRHLGWYYALVDLGPTGDAAQMYNEPGRMAAVGGPKAPAFFVFAADRREFDRFDPEAQKALLREAYRGAGWRVPELLAALDGAGGIHVDSISRVRIDRYATGRVVLLGDAGYGNVLGGFGTGLALVGAYVLAGELGRAGDVATALRRYEELMRPYATISRRGNAGGFLAPRTRLGIRVRNALFAWRPLLTAMLRLTERFATDIDLPDY